MTDLLRIGIAGAGKIVVSEHAPRFRAIEGVEIVAVANQTLESSERAAAALGIPRAYRHWGELVEDDEIDAILVGTWPYLHAPIAIEALYGDKHVLTEARMAANGEAAAAMADAATERPDLVAMVVPSSFSLWADRAIGRVLGDGTLGRLLAVRATWDSGPGTNPSEFWRWQTQFSGTNVMALGILYEAMARWLGQAEWVTAETQVVNPRKPAPGRGPVPTDVPDHVIAVAGFAGDVTAVMAMLQVFTEGLVPKGVETVRECVVRGDEPVWLGFHHLPAA